MGRASSRKKYSDYVKCAGCDVRLRYRTRHVRTGTPLCGQCRRKVEAVERRLNDEPIISTYTPREWTWTPVEQSPSVPMPGQPLTFSSLLFPKKP